MAAMLIGYARCSTDDQDLTAQRDGLSALGVKPKRLYVDHGLTGRNRDRPGLREALAACRAGDTLVVTKLDRLARSLPDARDIVEELTVAEVKLNIGGSVHDPNDPIGRLLFNVLAMIAEFESDPSRLPARTARGRPAAAAARPARIARRYRRHESLHLIAHRNPGLPAGRDGWPDCPLGIAGTRRPRHACIALLAVGHIRTVRYSIARSFPGRARSARFWFLSQRGSTKSWSSV